MVLAFGMSVCRPHIMSFVLLPSIFSSIFHGVTPFQTKNAGAPHSPQTHLQADRLPCKEGGDDSRCADAALELQGLNVQFSSLLLFIHYFAVQVHF